MDDLFLNFFEIFKSKIPPGKSVNFDFYSCDPEPVMMMLKLNGDDTHGREVLST